MKTIIGILIVVSGWLSVCGQNEMVKPERDLLADARKSLSGATGISVVSMITQGVGYGLIKSSMNDNGSAETGVTGVFLGIGGIGLQTNSPILVSRAYRQVKKWECPADDALAKQKILNSLMAAKMISIARTVLPLAGIMATSISSYNGSDSDKTEAIFFGFWAASIVLAIPEIILIENSRSQIKSYQQQLKLGTTEQGLGMIYQF
jgi:hypothetical protein